MKSSCQLTFTGNCSTPSTLHRSRKDVGHIVSSQSKIKTFLFVPMVALPVVDVFFSHKLNCVSSTNMPSVLPPKIGNCKRWARWSVGAWKEARRRPRGHFLRSLGLYSYDVVNPTRTSTRAASLPSFPLSRSLVR